MTTTTKLPEANYYRAAALGNGAYGAVCIAYDDDGNEWAAKLFWDENGEEEDDDCWDDDYNPTGGVDCGANGSGAGVDCGASSSSLSLARSCANRSAMADSETRDYPVNPIAGDPERRPGRKI